MLLNITTGLQLAWQTERRRESGILKHLMYSLLFRHCGKHIFCMSFIELESMQLMHMQYFVQESGKVCIQQITC
ncbi:hypothetical protein ACOSQ3_013338 [Xanthoceras sorbifolium]